MESKQVAFQDELKDLRIQAFELWLKAQRDRRDYEAEAKDLYDVICSLK